MTSKRAWMLWLPDEVPQGHYFRRWTAQKHQSEWHNIGIRLLFGGWLESLGPNVAIICLQMPSIKRPHIVPEIQSLVLEENIQLSSSHYKNTMFLVCHFQTSATSKTIPNKWLSLRCHFDWGHLQFGCQHATQLLCSSVLQVSTERKSKLLFPGQLRKLCKKEMDSCYSAWWQALQAQSMDEDLLTSLPTIGFLQLLE